jgi:hypothetical protein
MSTVDEILDFVNGSDERTCDLLSVLYGDTLSDRLAADLEDCDHFFLENIAEELKALEDGRKLEKDGSSLPENQKLSDSEKIRTRIRNLRFRDFRVRWVEDDIGMLFDKVIKARDLTDSDEIADTLTECETLLEDVYRVLRS